MKIIKRNGSEVTFDVEKIANAIRKANQEVPEDERLTEREIKFASLNVTDECMEPENQTGLVDFLERVRATYPEKNIWMYSGHTWEQLTKGAWHLDDTDRILTTLDVLVDGPFVQDDYDISLRFRGSSNQRIIDVPASLAAGEVVPWKDKPIFSTHTM